MLNIIVTSGGADHVIGASTGVSVMEVIRGAGISALAAMCGGCLSCATCHVYVDAEFMPKLAPQSGGEVDLLSFSEHRRPNSRLACQIPFSEELNGLRVEVVQED